MPPARASASGHCDGRATLALVEALGSSLDIREVLERAYPLLLSLAPADYGALGISSTGRPEDFAWTVAQIPPSFFAAYPEMAAHDFVREAVAARPNVVIRDEEMIARAELEQNVLYRRAREVGAPIEQVMAVMLHIDTRWQSGLSLYRDRRKPFTEREREALQRVTPALANAVRNCHLFGGAAGFGAALEVLLAGRGASVVLVTPPSTEVARTAGATRILERWFAPHELRAGRLPAPIAAALAPAFGAPLSPDAPPPWTREGEGATLHVTMVPLPGHLGQPTWMLLLEERPHAPSMPPSFRVALSPREQEVAAAVLRGWDNRLIAAELQLSEATVKKHLSNIFDKLGLPSRAALIARAAELGPR
jgi:DNA-binding CsgD family transcriptional regulator